MKRVLHAALEIARDVSEPFRKPPIEIIANSQVLPEDSPDVINTRTVIASHLGSALRRAQIATAALGAAAGAEVVADANIMPATWPIAFWGISKAIAHYNEAHLHSEQLPGMGAATWTTEPATNPSAQQSMA